MNVQDYKQHQPRLSLFDYFKGETRGWGMFQDRSGKLKRQFVVDIVGTINAQDQLVLEEDFVWNDGEKTKRVWTITKDTENNFSGTADDVIGKAKGSSAGNAFHWNYVVNLPVGNKKYKIHFDDWMFLQADGVLLNRAKMSKLGFAVGEVFISFKK